MKYMNAKRMVTLLCATALVVSFAGCGKKDKSAEVDYAEITMNDLTDGLNVDELVTKVVDFTKMEYELQNDYSVTDEYVENSLEYIISQISRYEEVTGRDEIKEGDYILADYTGYLDGEAFAGGTAEDQYILVSEDNGYIPGFTDGLKGKKVGETVTNDVTFPDPYLNNEELSGKETQFTFVIKGIYKHVAVTLDTITDQDVVDNYSDYNISTVEELKSLVREQCDSQADYYKRSEISDFIVGYIMENSEVTIPDEYLEKRIAEEKEKGSTEDDESIKESMTITIKQEILLLKAAQDLGVTIEESVYDMAVSNLAAQNYLQDANALYASIGNGDARKGEITIRRWYLMNEAINKLVDLVKVKEPSSVAS